VLRALESVAPPFIPRLIGVWQDSEIYPHTFSSTARMAGRDFLPVLPQLSFEELSGFLSQVGRLIGAVHNLRLDDMDLPPAEEVSADAWATGWDTLRSRAALGVGSRTRPPRSARTLATSRRRRGRHGWQPYCR